MADTQFTALAAQDTSEHKTLTLSGAEIGAVSDMDIFAVNYRAGDESRLPKALGPLPRPGKSVAHDRSHLLWTGAGQLFCVTEGNPSGDDTLTKIIGDAGHVTDLTDGWVVARISGPRAQVLMNQLVMPDLGPDAFAIGDVTSTVFAHLRVVIWRNADDQFTLMSAASSSGSFWHALSDELQTASRYQE